MRVPAGRDHRRARGARASRRSMAPARELRDRSILVLPKMLVALVAPFQNDVAIRKRLGLLRVEPILTEQPEQVVQLKIVKAFSQRSLVELISHCAELIVAKSGLDLRSADQTRFAGQHSLQLLPVGSLKKILHRHCRRAGRARFASARAKRTHHIRRFSLRARPSICRRRFLRHHFARRGCRRLCRCPAWDRNRDRNEHAVRSPNEVSECVPRHLILQLMRRLRLSPVQTVVTHGKATDIEIVLRLCSACGKPFRLKRSWQKQCSARCRQRAYIQRQPTRTLCYYGA